MRWLLAALFALAVASILASGCLAVSNCTSDADCPGGACHPTYHFCVTVADDGGTGGGGMGGGTGGAVGGGVGGGTGGAPDGGCASCGTPACLGAVCRPAVDACDVPESCTSGGCPPDARRDSGAGCPQACQLDRDCADAGYCGDGGVCAPKLSRGEACASAGRCATGACADGVCCDTPCAGGCDVCNQAGSVGTCVVVDAGLPGAGPSCSPYLCDGTSGQCPTSCSGGGCAAGSVCLGNVCSGKLGTGQPCGDAGVCATGFCVDGVCCDSACTGACQACNVDAGALANGTCVPVALGTDPKKHCGLFTCGGSIACASSCSGAVGCASGAHCCGSGCFAGSGTADGLSCSTGSDCASCTCPTYFVDGDGDGYGSTATVNLCGTTPPSGFAVDGGDCCDTDRNAFPGQTSYFTGPRNGCGGYDYDCSGADDKEYVIASATCGNPGIGCVNRCQATNVPGWTSATVPACGSSGSYMDSCVSGMMGSLCTCTITSRTVGGTPAAPIQACR